ncbi:MAG: hypothetical protein KDE28_11235, partial [Anaerolineales bacterium]|nr:hypothetical protein [Anaerolineales bacterium]
TDGGDSAHLRYRNLGAGSVELEIEEDTTEDSEIDHTTENVAWLAIAGDGQLQAAPASTVRVSYSFGGQAVALRLIGSSAEEGLYYLHRDHLGSVVLQSDAAGAVVSGSRNRYLP